jgi:hypothetical protein
MSVMSDMLADMLKKALPPEVMEMLTPENIKALGEKVNAFLIDHKDQIDRIENKLDKLTLATNTVMYAGSYIHTVEDGDIQNANSNDSDTGNGNASGKRSSSGRGKPKPDNGE